MEEEEQEQVYNFEGSDGQKYSAKKSELPELVEQAKAAGVVLKGVMSKEESTAARDDEYWTWDNAKAGVRGIWDDPTGEHGALAYMGLNVASGLGRAAGKVIGGMIKGAADVGFGLARGVARGVEWLVGADGHAVSGFLGDWHDSFNEITDALTPDLFEKRGMYDGIEGAHETMGAINSFAESVFAMKGMGLAAKGVGAIAGGKKAAAIGQAVVAAGMGGKGYAEMAEDQAGPGGWRQELAAAAKGGIEAAMFGVLGPWKKMNMAMPKPFEQLTKTEIVKRFTLEALKSGAMMGGVAAAKEGVEALATAGTDQKWHKKSAWEVSKTVMSEFLVGSAFHAVNALGKSGAWLAWRADRKNGEGAITFQVEQNRKTYAPIMNRQAELALRARETGAGWLEAGMEGTENVKRVLPNGAVQFDDGSVWQMGKDGRARITVADGTILDARTGAVEGYRANREAAAPEEGSVSGDNIAGNQRAENAALMLDALERGELPTVAEPLEGLAITETSYKKGTVLDGEWDQAKAPPVIVWVGNDGTRVLVTGRSRAAAAAAAGVKEIKAVEIHEGDWTREQAESLDAVENMREGRGTREEIARGVEALGIRSEEDCDRYEIVPERPVLDAITVLNEGSEALRNAATAGTVGRAWAAECAERLGKKSLGEASERAQATALDMIAGKLPPEEAGAAMDAIAELAARKPDYTDREAADAIRAARERAVGRVAVDADSEMVEMPDGTIKSVAEAKAEGAAQAQEAEAESKSIESGWRATAPAAPGADKAAEPTVKADGSVGCVRFEGAKATRTRSEDGREIVLIEGMTGEEMMRPENRDAAVQFVTRLKEMAGDVDLVFADVSAADAAEALLMAKRVQARAEEARSSVSGDSIAGSNQLVDAGQRLVDGLFGEKSGIRVRTGTREEAEAALRAAGETKPIKDAEGQVQGYYHRGKGEVVLFEGADAGTLAHEIGWHAVWHWAERNSPDLLLKMKRYAARTPLKLKAQIKEVYGDFKGEELMDEIGAGRFERAMGERFQKLLAKSPEVRGWWRKVLHALARAWKGMARTVGGNRVDLKKIEKMDPEEAIEALTAQMLEGRRLGEGRGNAEGEIRPSIGGIYTGTAADYANRSRQGGVDDGPSVKKIGTGEGSQVYGWGLYGSTVRGVAEVYARQGDYKKNGKPIDVRDEAELYTAKTLEKYKSVEAAINGVRESIHNVTIRGGNPSDTVWPSVLRELKAHGSEYSIRGERIYEQTFFTNRAEGDESHLLKWYEPVTSEQKQWIADELNKSIDDAKMKWVVTENGLTRNNPYAIEEKFKTGQEAYQFAIIQAAVLAKSKNGREYPKLASELLARAGIDGVKYPVDSYGGKGVKDGDVAGWNYVSFRDDNIRVDHKWTDGQIRYSRALAPEERPEGTAERSEKVNTTLRRLEEIQRLKKEGTADFYKKVNEEFGADYTFDLGTPYGMLGEFLEAKPVQLKMRTLLRKKKESYKSHHPFTFEEAQDVVTNINEPAMILTRQNDKQGVRAFYEANTGRIFCVSVRPSGEVYDVETLYPKDVQRLVGLLKTLRGRKEDVLGLDVLKAISMFERQYDTTQPEQANGLADAISILKQIAEDKGEKLPPRKPLAEVVGAAQYRGGLPTGDAESISQQGGGAQKDSQQFKRWFADSKVVDENGEPLVVYRGSPYDPLAQEAGKGVIKPEAYFTADPEYAKRYTGNGGKVGAYYLNIRRPFDIRDPECLKDLQSIYPDHEFIKGKSGALDWGEASIVDGEFLRENFGDKYDGIVYDEGGDPTGSGVKYRGVSYVPLDGGAQVKSATNNIGTFDPGNPDIRFSIGGVRGAERLRVGKAADAEQMEKAGADREEIWRKTGWWRGKDGKWRVELPSMSFKPDMHMGFYERAILGNQKVPLSDIIDAPELFKAYPGLKELPVRAEMMESTGRKAYFDTDANEIVLNKWAYSRNETEVLAVMSHEIQHKIQELEGFAKGGNTGDIEHARELNTSLSKTVASMMDKLGYQEWLDQLTENKALIETSHKASDKYPTSRFPLERKFAEDMGGESGKRLLQKLDQADEIYADNAKEAHYGRTIQEAYRSISGEVEARNVSRRESMTPEERAATPPWATEDVPEDRQIIRFSRAMIGGKETAVAEGYPLSIREARDPEKVLGVLSPLVGKSAAQIGEMKLTRINAKSIEHMINTEHARADIKRSGKSAKKLWRGTVAGMSVTDDIVATSTLGTKEQPKHLNAEWKKGATFYRAKTRFAVETEEGRYEIYPCELIVAEKNGERIVYDITEIGATTLSAAASQKGSTVGSQLKDGATAHGGVGATPQSISQQGGGAQGEIRPSIKKRRDEVYDDVLRAVRAGGQRVAAGRSERTEAGFDAGAALWMEREGQMGKSQDGSMTISLSESVRMIRALSASKHLPKILEKMPHLATRDRKGNLRLNAAAFGIVDKSSLEAVKAGLKKDGLFLHEDPSWRLHNDYEEVRAMKEMSEQALAEEMQKLADDIISGKRSGGWRTAININVKEIGRIACELPVTAGAPQSLKDLRKLGLGIARELGDPKGELGKEAREAARWWREQDPARKDPTATKSEDIAESELWAEMFGMFLADPMALEERAPNVYGKMVEAIAGNEKLSEAWNGLRRTRDAEGPHERVMRDIERQWSVNEQQAYKELLAELDKPIGKWGKRTRARLLLELHSAEGPAVMWVTDAVRERLAELKRLKKAGKIGEEEYDLLAGGAKRELEKMRVALLHKQRGGGTGRLYALDFASGVMEDVARDGVDMGDLRRYMYAKSVRDGLHQKGKAAALGMDQREAQKVLEELEGRLGADGWAKLETAAKRFQATREQHLLENEFVLEAFGKDLVNYWKMNASYVRSERTWTAEEVAAYEAARSDWMARHPGESTVIAEIEALMDMHVAKGSGTAGSSFLKPLAGSLKAVKDPIAATLENDLRIIEFAQRNHWACQLAESAKTLGMEGFAVMEDRGGGGKLRGSNRYGSVTFLKDGKRMTLVMPKVVAEGFEHDSRGVSKLVKLNRWASAILTQYSPRFALRNIWRNRASNANNIAWMGEGRLVTGMGMVGMRPVARLATFLLERAASHLPDRFARNAFMNLLYGSKTNVYWEAESTRIAKIMTDPIAMRERAERAERLASQGKTGEAQRIWEDIEKAKAAMGLPIFAGIRENMWGEADKTDLDAVFRSMGMDTNFDGKKLTKMQLVKRRMKDSAEKVKRFNDFEEARVKLIALLAAEHESMRLENKGENWGKSRDEITYQVATMSGSPRYENRGRVMNYIESALGPFMNVGMKGAWRTIEAMRYDPKRWWTKAAGRIAGRLATYVLWMGGGYKLVADWLRGDAGDDEEKNKRVDAFERFGKRMAHALANCSDYRLRNYDIVPVGLYGKWSTLAISMPRGDEDKLIMPAVDWLVHGLLGSEKAQEMGFALPTDLNYTGSQAVQSTVFGSGIIPDPLRRGLIWTVAQDAIMPWLGYNPYNSYTQRSVYNQDDVDARWEEPWNMAKKVGKQVWNDLGGQVVMPATTWDEDEGAYDDQGQWALSGAEEGEAGCMPIGGKTIFQALHSIPFLSAAASGLITFQNGGNERIARRLEKYRRDDSAPLRAAAQRVADEVIEAVRANGEDFDYSEMLAARVSELGLPEEDAEIIEGLAFKKVQGIAAKMGSEFDPIGKTLRKMSNDEKMYRRAKRQVEAEGWDGDFD